MRDDVPDDRVEVGGPAQPSPAVEEELRRAMAMGGEGDWEGMAERLRESVEEHEDDPFLLCGLGVAERELGLEGVAYERFKRCLAARPQDAYVLATAGNALAAFDDPEAEGALRTAALLAPELPLARWMYGAYLSREGLVEEALGELDAARELAPDLPVVHLERGIALALGGDVAGAVDDFDRAAEMDPDDGWPRILLGLALVEQERLDEAAAALDRGARLRPHDPEAQLLAALADMASGWEDRAWEMLERARQSAEGVDRATVEEGEERLSAGAESALAFLVRTIAPIAFRERLMERP